MRVINIESPGRYVGSADKNAIETITFHCDNCEKEMVFHDMHKNPNEPYREHNHE
jgi:hypothetical protein